MIQTDSTAVTTTAIAAQSSTSAILVGFYHDALHIAVPFIFPCLALIVADLVFGCAAAKRRGETVRASRAIRRTGDKLVSYTCWVILAATLAVAFSLPSLNKLILAVVMCVELISVISNYFAMRGKKVDGLWQTFLKVLGKKVDADLSDIKITDENGRI